MVFGGIALILGYVKSAVLLSLKKLWVPLVFFFSIVPGILGTYSYLRGEEVAWFFAAPATLGIEFGGKIPMLVNSLEYLTDPTSPLLPFVIGSVLGVLNLYWAWYLYSFVIKKVDPDFSPIILYGTFALFFLTWISFALVVDMHVLPDQDLQVSGLTYFLENPGQAVDPVTQFVGERAAEDSVLNQTVNNTNMTS